MDKNDFELTVLGARGSMAVCRPDCMTFGGNTSCYMVRAGDETIFLDGGSGLINAPTQFEKPPVILLSHFHLDHVMGLGMYPRLLIKGEKTIIYLPCESIIQGRAILNGVFSPPYWPLSLMEYTGTLILKPFRNRFKLGEVKIETMCGFHPGDCLVIRIFFHGKSLVYATDCEPGPKATLELAEFARGADLLLYDGQYAADVYPKREGFGHSTAEKGIEIMEQSDVRRMLLIHHDPHSTDSEILKREKTVNRKNVRYAREGETIAL